MRDMKKVFAIIDCSIPINTRNQKIIDSLKISYENAEIHVITWNREGLILDVKDKFFHAYDKIAPYADAKAKLCGIRGFKKYIKQVLENISADVIIASHWSNLMLVAGVKKKSQVLIYENLDIPTGRFPIRQLERLIERTCLRKVNLIIHASRFFRPLYNKVRVPQIVLENKPVFAPNIRKSVSGKPLKVAFVGTIRYKDILQNLADALMNNTDFELYFHGSGHDCQALKEHCKNANNVFFTGKYDYSSVVSLYHQSDIIWAGYPNKDYNVVYAISNKFHESLYVGVPCVFSTGTKLADFVKKNCLGFVVDPYDTVEIKELFQRIASGQEDINRIKESMQAWQSKEAAWADDFKQVAKFLNK